MSTQDGAGRAALLGTAALLWPGADIRSGRLSKGTLRGGSGEEYALVPSARRPRMMVPVTPPSAAASALCRFSAASRRRDVLARLTVAGITRTTRGALLRDRVTVGTSAVSPQQSLREHLSEILGEPVAFSLSVGPARVNRKPVLQVFDRRGHTLGFAKVGDSEQALADVRSEAAALRLLEGRRLTSLIVPTVLSDSMWGEMAVLLMSPLRTGTGLRTADVGRVPRNEMRCLSRAFDEGSGPLGELAWWRRQAEATERMDDPGLRDRLQRCLSSLAERYATATVEVGAWHGDWTPWNMARSRSRLLLWDWERFETGVPVGLDAWHYRINTATRRHGLLPEVVLACIARSGGRAGRDDVLADLYLVAITVRYAGLVSAARGMDIAPGAAAMLAALEARCGAPSGGWAPDCVGQRW